MSKIRLYTNDCKTFYKETTKSYIDYNDVIFPYFPAKVWITEPAGEISLQYFLNSHKNPKDSIVETLREIEEAAKAGDTKRKDELKQSKLFYFTPTTELTYRDYEHITHFNPLIVAEYDKVGEDAAKRLKRQIFDRFDSCICAYLSPSKTGVKFLFYCDKFNSVEEYKEYFYGLAYYLFQIPGFDLANRNPTLPLFVSYDRDMLIRSSEELSSWDIRGYKEDEFNIKDYTEIEVQENVDPAVEELIVERIQNFIDSIEDNAHPRVVSFCFLVGGWVGANQIQEHIAWDTIEEAIENNEYMSKGTSGYLKTANQMFEKGKHFPKKFEL